MITSHSACPVIGAVLGSVTETNSKQRWEPADWFIIKNKNWQYNENENLKRTETMELSPGDLHGKAASFCLTFFDL